MTPRSPSRRHPLSPSTFRSKATVHTKYSVDLDALRGPESDTSSLPELHNNTQLDFIQSEDIDGPTDFTQNMEFWMRAPLVAQLKAQQPTRNEPMALENKEIAGDLEEYIESDEHGDIQVERFQLANVPLSMQDKDDAGSVNSLENQEKVLSYLETLPDADVPSIHVQSPQGLLRAPLANRKAKSLQPTVEDYDGTATTHESSLASPITEGKISQISDDNARYNEQSHQISQLQEEIAKLTSWSKTRIGQLEQSLSVARKDLEVSRTEKNRISEELERVLKGRESALPLNTDTKLPSRTCEVEEKELQQQIHDLRAELSGSRSLLLQTQFTYAEANQILQLQLVKAQRDLHSSAVERASVDQIQRKHEGEVNRMKSDYESSIASHQDMEMVLRSQFDRQRTETQQSKESAEMEMRKALQAQRVGFEETIRELKEEITDVNQKLETQDRAVLLKNQGQGDMLEKVDLQSRMTELENQFHITREQLRETQRGLAIKLREEASESQQRLHGNQLYTSSATRIADLESGVTGIREQLGLAQRGLASQRDLNHTIRKNSNGNPNAEKPLRRDADIGISELRFELGETQSNLLEAQNRLKEHEQETGRRIDQMRTRAENAVKRMAELLEVEKNDKIKVRKELRILKKQLAAGETREILPQTLILPVESSESYLTLLKERDLLKTRLEKAHAEIEITKRDTSTLREEYESVNQAMDKRILDVVRDRERKWAQRVEAIVKENLALKRTLLHEWGKEECGFGDPQMYRYKFVQG